MSARLKEIEARLKAATPGPWELFDGTVMHKSATLAVVYDAENFPCLDEEDYDEVQAEGRGNAQLMVNAPADLAWLVAQVRRAWIAGYITAANGKGPVRPHATSMDEVCETCAEYRREAEGLSEFGLTEIEQVLASAGEAVTPPIHKALIVSAKASER